jgi:hypothetical protein
VVITNGPASSGVWSDVACTTPILRVPVAPSIGSRSASKLAQSSFTPETGVMPASLNTRDVHSRQCSSFLGASMAGGPAAGLVVSGCP